MKVKNKLSITDEKSEIVEDIVEVPKDRIGAVIGENGKTKREIEKLTDTKLKINSETGDVAIQREIKKNPENALGAQDIIRAIAIGFAPRKAFKLLSSQVYMDTIDFEEHVKQSQISRVKARVIGTEGKARNYISKLTGTDIVIYRNKVSILGDADDVDAARTAVMMLIDGASHKTVFKFLEKRKIK